MIKDHEIRNVVSDLCAIAKDFGNTQQLRDRIANYIVPHLRSADTTRLDFMLRTGAVVQWYGETCQLHGSAGVISGAGEFYESAREAIDAAMARETLR